MSDARSGGELEAKAVRTAGWYVAPLFGCMSFLIWMPVSLVNLANRVLAALLPIGGVQRFINVSVTGLAVTRTSRARLAAWATATGLAAAVAAATAPILSACFRDMRCSA